ncbi:hypothetical protein N7494_006619 [Penicillium frequentans]|uniref:N-acetyltransferase domain-containing protein n=1 Tax=Penicillium frequentans TaxID=3151616 RepID=A0AAD6CZ03_9EURO|nr:hypothetical protein N7494_006619 [Penicillium glabrum]
MGSTDLQKQVGQLFAVGFHGHTPSPEIKTLIHEYHVGGIIIFSRNFQDAAQLQALTLALQNEARLAGHTRPLLIGIDQENGLVTRISPPIATQVPGPMALGATGDPGMAYQAGKATGETLELFGINMNYAPVCDINSEPLNPVIGVRSPGDDPEFVGKFASAAARGLREQNVVPSVKHFPGHGDTATDSHYGLPVIPKSRDELERCELIPFRRAVAEGIETVMTAHISLPEIDDRLPATLSPNALGILRKDMAYDGMIITDCLEMDGIRATVGTEQGSVLAIKAGSDSIMLCHTFEVQVASIKKVCEAVQSGTIESSRLEDACRHVAHVKDKFLNWDTALRQNRLTGLDALNNKTAPFSKEAYEKSVTLVRDISKTLPLKGTGHIVLLFPGSKIPVGGAVDGEGMGRQGSYKVSPYLNALQCHNPSVTEIKYKDTGLSNEEWNVVKAADAVIFVSINGTEAPYQDALGRKLPRHVRSLVAIAACSPYDFLEVPDIQTYITTYEPTIEAFTVAAGIIFGQMTPRGSLPIAHGPSRSSVPVAIFNAEKDLDEVVSAWSQIFPTYRLPTDSLGALIVRENAHHFVVRLGSDLAGFCLAYLNAFGPPSTVHIAVLGVAPKHQGQGIGTALLMEARSYFRMNLAAHSLAFGPYKVSSLTVASDSAHLGIDQWIYTRIFATSSPPEKYVKRAQDRGFRFAPLQSEDYEACLVGQKKNFSDKAGWVEAYVWLHPSKFPSCVMTAFDSEDRQVGWTLMLPPCPEMNQSWAFPQICGPKTGLIGCVGVDADHRASGIGLALVCHAVENMKQRGIEGVFVDWVALDGWYEQVGFKTWRSYRPGEI